MADITCEYTITGTDQTGYFLLPRDTTHAQLVEFIRENVHSGDFVLKNYRREEITTSEQLDQLLQISEEFLFPLYIEPVVAEEPVPEPEPELVKEEVVEEEAPVPAPDVPSKPTLGPICTRVLSELGVEVEIEEGFDPLDLIHRLPRFVAPLVKARYQEILANPDALEPTLHVIADLVGEPYEEFSSEVKHTLEQLRQQNEKAESQEQKQEQEQEQEQEQSVAEEEVRQEPPVLPPQVVHPAYCDKCQITICDIRYKCIQCPDYDLCVLCENEQSYRPFHNPQHVFAKVYKPSLRPLPAHMTQPLLVPMFFRGVPLAHPSPVPPPCPPPHFHPRGARAFHQRVSQLEQTVKNLQDQLNKLQ